MIKFEEKVEPPKKAKKPDGNQSDQIKEAASEKRKKMESTDLNNGRSTRKNKEN